MKLFVYGTLMQGERAHRLLQGATPLGAVVTEPRYTLVMFEEGFPGLLDSGHTAVAGELYALPALAAGEADARLARLDDYEGLDMYERVLRPFGEHEAWVYLLRPEHADGGRVIASGDFRRR